MDRVDGGRISDLAIRPWMISVAFAVTYAGAVLLGRTSVLNGSTLALVWPAPAVGFLWLAVAWGGRWRHVQLNLLALGLVTAAVNIAVGTDPVLCGVFAIGNCLQAVVTCLVFQRLRPRPWRLRGVTDLGVLALACLASALTSSAVGPVGLWLDADRALLPTAAAWLVRNATNMFVICAVALRLADRGLPRPWRDSRQLWEMSLAGLVFAVAYTAVFAQSALPLAFLLVPCSMWVALRFDTTIAAGHVLVTGVFVTVFAMQQRGPFSLGSTTTRTILTQAFSAVVAVVTLVLALTRDERQELVERLGVARRDAVAQADLLDAVFDSVTEGLVVAAADGTMLMQNPASSTMMGLDADPASVGNWPATYGLCFPDGSSVPPAQLPLAQALGGAEVTGVDFLARSPVTPQGRLLTISARPLPGPAGQHGAVAVLHDVTAIRRAQAELQHQALHDPLTGLANRTLLNDRLEQILAGGVRSGSRAGVLCLDLDGFKAVNDSAGHAAGDELLVQVAQRLTRAVRPGDTVARLGGDEFAIVCGDVDGLVSLRVVADRILDAARAPFELGPSGTHVVSASVGIALSDADTTAAELLREADEAMYGAKRTGKNRVAEGPRLPVRRAGPASLVEQLSAALADDELVLHGQPVVDLGTGRPVAVEAMLRWQHPIRGLLPASEFLAVAEQSPLLAGLSRRTLEEACRLAASWAELLGGDAPDVYVALSGREVQAGVTGNVLAALHRYKLPAARLVLELTSTHLPQLDDAVRQDLARLRERGVRLAIEDLGTGYGSLTRLVELPVDMLKIDARFVAGLGVDPGCDAVVKAILGLGESLGLAVVAQGVQTHGQATQLRAYGCGAAQGYLYSPPRPEQDLLAYLRRERIRA